MAAQESGHSSPRSSDGALAAGLVNIERKDDDAVVFNANEEEELSVENAPDSAEAEEEEEEEEEEEGEVDSKRAPSVAHLIVGSALSPESVSGVVSPVQYPDSDSEEGDHSQATEVINHSTAAPPLPPPAPPLPPPLFRTVSASSSGPSSSPNLNRCISGLRVKGISGQDVKSLYICI